MELRSVGVPPPSDESGLRRHVVTFGNRRRRPTTQTALPAVAS
jgi:hypothetical protein